MEDQATLKKIISILNQMLSGEHFESNEEIIPKDKHGEFAQFVVLFNNLVKQYVDSYDFILCLAKGKLDVTAPTGNPVVSAYKQLHSELRHLIWQIQQIAAGDYNQKVSFSGDFAEAINKMIVSLKEREILSDLHTQDVQLFKTIFDTSPDGMLVSDLAGKVQFISDSGLKMFRLDAEDLHHGINIFDYIAPEYRQKVASSVERLLSGQPSGSEYRAIAKDGEGFWIESNSNAIYDSKKEMKGFFVIFRDITKRKKDEETLRNFAEQMKSVNAMKDKFFSIIAHDLKNPFYGLVELSALMLEDIRHQDYNEIGENIKLLHESAKQGLQLLNNLLDWARSQTGDIILDIRPINVNFIIAQVINLILPNSMEKKISINNYVDIKTIVYADGNILSTVIRNLLTNAVKFTYESGTVNIRSWQKGESILVSVEDNGIGIEKSKIEKLFRIDNKVMTLGTKKEKGTGLGLILCKDFINKLGGDIWVESECGKGTSFIFSLPIDKRERNILQKAQ